jgi:hypothetical protein
LAVFEAVEYATLEWVDWFNNRRLMDPIGNPRGGSAPNFLCRARSGFLTTLGHHPGAISNQVESPDG